MKAYIMIISLMLASCASAPKEIYLNTGDKASVVSCSPTDMDHCYSQAGKICESKGYNTFNKSRDNNGYIQLTITCRN